jgi:hypothetical protein
MATLAELKERRAFACRLVPERALESIEEAVAFLRNRGLLTRSTDSALPSLHEACHEEPYAPGKPGFGSWPATKYLWGFELADRPGVYELKIHRGKTLFLSGETARLADPVLRAEIDRLESADPGWARLLGHLAEAGPSLLEDLRLELGLPPKELKDLRSPLERCGAVVSRSVRIETDAGHTHSSELARWDSVFPEPAGGEPDPGSMLVAGVRAAVVAPERELGRWFSWSWRFSPALVERLVEEGELVRPEPGWVALP